MADLNGDGYDDETGEPVSPYERAWEEAGRPDDTTPEGANYYGDLDQEEYAQQRARARDRGQRWGEQTASGSSSSGRASDFDEGSADIPIWGWLSGAQSRRDAARAESEADRAAAGWDELGNWMPTPDELAVDYEQSAYVGPDGELVSGDAAADPRSIEAQMDALRAMQEVYEGGGLTHADRARMALGRQEVGRDVRAQREADQSALAARGMAGSGQGVASMLAGQQYGAEALSGADAQMQMSAQQRALQAMQSAGSLGTQARGQSFDEDAHRRGSIDEWNRMNTEYRRDWTEGNTDRRNQSRESRSDARQTAYENRERQQAGRTNQWQSAAGGRRADQQRQDEANAAGAGAIGTLISEIL